MATTDIETQIDSSATSPKTVTIDGTTTTEHPLPEQIAADRYRRANRAMSNAGCGCVFQKIVPHGSVR
jgi:hypothetical protein